MLQHPNLETFWWTHLSFGEVWTAQEFSNRLHKTISNWRLLKNKWIILTQIQERPLSSRKVYYFFKKSSLILNFLQSTLNFLRKRKKRMRGIKFQNHHPLGIENVYIGTFSAMTYQWVAITGRVLLLTANLKGPLSSIL